MLAITDTATEAIEGILSAPAVPDGAGLRITASPGPDPTAPEPDGFDIAIVAAPAEGDQVIDESGARVFVEDPVTDYLDDKLLDARVSGEQVSFVLATQVG